MSFESACKFYTRLCPVCGGADARKMFRQDFAKIVGVSFLEGYDVVSCEGCGFVYADNIPEQADFDSYYINSNMYELDYEYQNMLTGKHDHIIQEIINLNIDKTASIADIGCGRSEVLRNMLDLGFTNLTGIDPSVKNVDFLKNKGINSIHATLSSMNTLKQFDVVFFLGVLEHVVNVNQTLQKLYEVIKKNGILAIGGIPDMESPPVGDLPYQMFSREHINYFTKVSLSNLMMRHGFYAINLKNVSGNLVGLFKKIPKEIQNDKTGQFRVQSYILQSEKYEDEIVANLMPYKDIPLIVWGLGTFGQRILEKKIMRNIIVLVDSNPQYFGKTYGSISVIPPNELKRYRETILLAVSPHYVDAIIRTIRNEMELENEIIKLPPAEFGQNNEYTNQEVAVRR